MAALVAAVLAALDKAGGFIGREAVAARKAVNAEAGGMRQRIVQLRVLDPDGTQVEELDLPEGAVCLNCCFGGDDLRTLFVTNAGHGTVLAFEGMPAQGMLAHPFQMS